MDNQFDDYFSKIYLERWPELKKSLSQPEDQVLRVNRFVYSNDTTDFLNDWGHFTLNQSELRPFQTLIPFMNRSNIFIKPKELKIQVPRFHSDLLSYYVMDPASLFPVSVLQVEPKDQVLDMCAAPGGKTLILAEDLFLAQNEFESSSVQLLANDLSMDRRDRLKRVLHQYVPDQLRRRIQMTGKDGGLFVKNYSNAFDKILVDAPCSGERHLINDKGEAPEWTLKKSESVAQRQYALLTSALLCVKPQGRIVYSTCSINPIENDQVISRLLKKKSGFKVLKPDIQYEFITESEFGYWILPDKKVTINNETFGFGPIYFSVLEKL